MAGKTRYKVGDEFPNRKRITEYVGSHPKWRVSVWLWECMDCGTPGGPSTTSQLTRTDRQRAKCCMSRGRSAGYWKGYEDISGTWLGQYKYGAQKRGITWNVTPEYLWEQWLTQAGRCAYTDWQLKHGDNASLDRIDNSEGYIVGNIQWVHTKINKLKSDFSENEFLFLCRAVALDMTSPLC